MREQPVINLDGEKLHVYLGEDEFFIEAPGRREARKAGQEILPPEIVPVREKPVWRGRIGLKIVLGELLETDDLDCFLRAAERLAAEPEPAMTEDEGAAFYDFLAEKRRYLLWKIFLCGEPSYALDIMDAFRGEYWYLILGFLADFPRAYELYDSTPGIFLLLALRRMPREEKKRLISMKQKDILRAFDLPGEKRFIKLIRKIPARHISEEIIYGLSTYKTANPDLIYSLEGSKDWLNGFLWEALKYNLPLALINEFVLMMPHRNPGFCTKADRLLILSCGNDFINLFKTVKNLMDSDPLTRGLHNKFELYEYECLNTYLSRTKSPRIFFPHSPLPESFDIKYISHIGELKEEADEMLHCCFSFLSRITSRKYSLFRMEKPERCTIGIELYKDTFYLDQIYLKGNEGISYISYLKVCSWLDMVTDKRARYDSYRHYLGLEKMG